MPARRPCRDRVRPTFGPPACTLIYRSTFYHQILSPCSESDLFGVFPTLDISYLDLLHLPTCRPPGRHKYLASQIKPPLVSHPRLVTIYNLI